MLLNPDGKVYFYDKLSYMNFVIFGFTNIYKMLVRYLDFLRIKLILMLITELIFLTKSQHHGKYVCIYESLIY